MNEKTNDIVDNKDPGCLDSNITGNIFYLALPVFYPILLDDIDESRQEKFLYEIDALHGAFYMDNVKIEYKSLKNIENYRQVTQLLPQKRLRSSKIFLFQMTISNASHLLESFDKSSANENFIISVHLYLETFAYSLAYALGIYCDGIFDIDDFVTYYNDAKYEISEGVLSTFSNSPKKNIFYGQTTELSLQKTLNWLLSIDDVINTCGKTALGKSLSIYSRMFSSTLGDQELFMSGLFSVMALEALYESNGARKTLIEKVAAYLNIDKQKCKKDIDEIYNHRCSVAHGGFELPFKFNAYDASEDFDKSYNKTENAFDLGRQYLFESYKKMIIQNKKELTFVYRCL